MQSFHRSTAITLWFNIYLFDEPELQLYQGLLIPYIINVLHLYKLYIYMEERKTIQVHRYWYPEPENVLATIQINYPYIIITLSAFKIICP